MPRPALFAPRLFLPMLLASSSAPRTSSVLLPSPTTELACVPTRPRLRSRVRGGSQHGTPPLGYLSRPCHVFLRDHTRHTPLVLPIYSTEPRSSSLPPIAASAIAGRRLNLLEAEPFPPSLPRQKNPLDHTNLPYPSSLTLAACGVPPSSAVAIVRHGPGLARSCIPRRACGSLTDAPPRAGRSGGPSSALDGRGRRDDCRRRASALPRLVLEENEGDATPY